MTVIFTHGNEGIKGNERADNLAKEPPWLRAKEWVTLIS